MESNQNQSQSVKIYAIIATLLLILATICAIYFWSQSRSLKNDQVLSDNQIDSLNVLKTSLEMELDSLTFNLDSAWAENESLQGNISSIQEKLKAKELMVNKISKEAAKDEKELLSQIEALKRAKTEIETMLTVLKTENEALKEENTQLKGEVTQLSNDVTGLKGEVQQLNQDLVEEMLKAQRAGFKATALRVDMERKNDKLTSKGKQIREFNVSFDLANVPEKMQGVQNIYMVITDMQGVPIKVTNPVKATIHAPAGDQEIIAQQAKQVNVGATQRLSFTYPVEEKMKAGQYMVAIYSEKGFLGSSSFRLM
jgi:predicted  nucleic acid-binding Zn-ribbon protein